MRGAAWRRLRWAIPVVGLVAMVAMDSASLAPAAVRCQVSLSIDSAGGAGLTAGQRVTMEATVSACTVPAGAYFLVLRQRVDSLGNRVGSVASASCAVPWVVSQFEIGALSVSPTTSSKVQTWSATPAAIAGVCLIFGP